jgi:hypothetical protein
MRGLIWKDKICPCDIEVIDGRVDGLWWDHTNKRNTAGRRAKAIRFGVLHHQGGEGKARQNFNVLNAREDPKNPGEFDYLSVHFEIDQEGVITQMADLDTACFHAGGVNQESWGVEIASVGVGTATHQYPREQYTDMVNGVTYRNFLEFFQAQIESAYQLCVYVNTMLGLPLLIPVDATGNKARRIVLTEDELAMHRGLVAHYMVTQKKKDPSPRLLDALIRRFAVAVAKGVSR